MKSDSITPSYEREAEQFYSQLLTVLIKHKLPFLIGGTFAVREYTGIKCPTKDIDIFCKAGDYPRILKAAKEAGYSIDILDDRWLAKIYKGNYFADIIFGSIPTMWPIDDRWFKHVRDGIVLNLPVKITPPEELIVSKMYRQGRTQFDGADVIHVLLHCGKDLDWKHLLNRVEPNWEVLLAHIILFRFVYPSERGVIPTHVVKELTNRIQLQLEMPIPKDKVCRGSMLSHRQYQIAYTEWGYKDITDFFYKGDGYPLDEEEKKETSTVGGLVQ